MIPILIRTPTRAPTFVLYPLCLLYVYDISNPNGSRKASPPILFNCSIFIKIKNKIY